MPRSDMEGFPSGQRGQTVNLLSTTSVVRIHSLPPKIPFTSVSGIFTYYISLLHSYLKINRQQDFWEVRSNR